jgi:hypothetical protein
MEKTGLGQVLDIAGDIALTQGAIKGVSGLKGLLTGGGQAGAAIPSLPAQAPMIETPVPASVRQMGAGVPAAAPKALPQGVTEVGRMASASPAEARALTAQMVKPTPMQSMVAPGAGAGPVTPRIGMPQMPTSLPPAGGAAPTPIASQVSAGMRPPTPPTPAPTFAAAPRPALPPAPSPMQAMTAPAAAPAAAPMAAPTGGMTPPMRATAQRMGGIENVANANITRGAGGLRGAAQFARENASWLGPAATATGNVIGSAIDRSVEEEKMRREQDAKNRLAMLLMPMFQQQMGQFGQMGQMGSSFQPRG